MREILFKAKQIDNNEWVEGWYYQESDGGMHNLSYIAAFKKGYNSEIFLTGCYEVDPDTVCQYTGLTDKNGRIFEGDICCDKCGFQFVVVWDSENARFLGLGIGKWKEYIRYVGQEPTVEVIGNIFDNPELTGGKTDV